MPTKAKLRETLKRLPGVKKDVAGEGHVDEGEDRGDEDPEGLPRHQMAKRTVGLPVDGVFDRRSSSDWLLARRAVVTLTLLWMAPVISPVTSSGETPAIGLSATLLPRRRTTIRSATANTSGMRWLIRMTPMP